MSVTTFWNTRSLDASVRRWKQTCLSQSGRHLKNAIRTLISVQGHPTYRRSLPGEPPRFETKDLLKSWTHQVMVSPPPATSYVDVSSNLDYSYYLEVGSHATFGYVAPRPSIRRALIQEEAALAAIFHQLLP